EGAEGVSENAGCRYFRAPQAPAFGRPHRPGEGALQRFHNADTPDFCGGAIDRSRRNLPARLFPVGASEAGHTATATAGTRSQRLEGIGRAPTRDALIYSWRRASTGSIWAARKAG